MRKYYTTHMSKAGMLMTMEKLFMLSKKATSAHTELTFLKKISVALLKAWMYWNWNKNLKIVSDNWAAYHASRHKGENKVDLCF